MPNTQAAKKRMRQSDKRRETNRGRKAEIRTFTRKVTEAIEAKDAKAGEAEMRKLQEKLDKAAKAATIHPNKAARRKSRMMKQLNKAKQG